MGERNRAIFVDLLRKNPGILIKITTVLPESQKQRAYLEGAVIPLVTFYQEGLDHQSSDDCTKVREWLKLEFNGQLLELNGKSRIVARSTKGREALNAFLERVVEWLQENYAPPAEALDPEAYKRWRDTEMMTGETTDYIDHLVETGVLKRGMVQ
ncbi:MAG: hypothetical protein ACK4UO_12965 [Pseudolabrys sp.]